MVPIEAQPERTTAQSTAPAAAPARSAPAPPAEPPEPATVAAKPVRVLQFEVADSEHKVEIHLSEHAGELHVAVRTPDPRLAADLREQLPSLSSRLEAPARHTAESDPLLPGKASQSPAAAEPSPSAVWSHETLSAGDRRQDGESAQRRPTPPDEPVHSRKKQKQGDFAWLMSTIS
jgi:hypothetical protein